MARSLRFRPPPIEWSEELEWLFGAAFGPDLPEQKVSLDAARVLKLALDLNLGARIASRHDASVLTGVLGAPVARQLAYQRLAAIAAHRLVVSAAERVVEHATRVRTEVVLLKHAALWARGLNVEGRRGARDLDLLVPASAARALQRALIDAGFDESGGSAQTHHLPALRSARGEVVEVHTGVLGISVRGVRPATAEALIAAELVERHELGSGPCWIPKRELLIAHAIVHGYAQHGSSPLEYPITRMLADVADMAENDAPDELAKLCHGWIGADMSLDEIRAVCRLVMALATGTHTDPESAERCLLRHVIAAASDADYQRALRLRRFDWLREAREWVPALRRLLAPTRADLELEHGPIHSPLALLLLGRWHALKKLGALASGLSAQVRLRLRRSPR